MMACLRLLVLEMHGMGLYCLPLMDMELVLLRYEDNCNFYDDIAACQKCVLLTSGSHSAAVPSAYFSLFHFYFLIQANRVRFEFEKGAADHTFMRIDGEPWKQPLPVDEDTVVVEISHLRQVNMLATPCCRSRSINDAPSPASIIDEDCESIEDESSEDWEERRKFGAADTFKIPEEVDITQLS